MANQSTVPSLAGRYMIEPGRSLAGAGGGLPACGAVDRLEPGGALMALRLGRSAPARAEAILTLYPLSIPGLLLPCAVGGHPDAAGTAAGWLVCQAPPGPDLQTVPHRWSEQEIINCVLQPVAAVLTELAERRVTHRAIRPNNLFRAGPGQPVTLGCAWATPPGALQPTLFEPLGSAVCGPAARGDGLIADDVYALGVLLLVLCLGRPPLPMLDDAAMLDRKLSVGSHEALTDGERVPQMILDLTRGMLAEDPEHRPPPAMLMDPLAARGRRVAARPPRKAQRAYDIGTETVWNSRALALALGRNPGEAVRELRSHAADRWLRHGLGDPTLAIRLDDLVEQRLAAAPSEDTIADATMVMRAVVLLDPLAPLWWRGLPLWPDALGPVLAEGNVDTAVQELIGNEVAGTWAAMAPDRNDAKFLQIEARRLRGLLRQGAGAGNVHRLCYVLNRLQPCASPLLDNAWVCETADLLPQLEIVAARAPSPTSSAAPLRLIDNHIAAFLAARMPRGADGELARLDVADPVAASLAQLRIFARLQEVAPAAPVPALAALFVAQCRPVMADWPHLQRITEAETVLPALIADGRLDRLLALFDDPARDQRDAAARDQVRDRVARIDHALQTVRVGNPARRREATVLGGQIAVGLGAATLAGIVALWFV